MRDDRRGLGTGLTSAAAFGTSGALATALLASGWTAAAAVTLRVTIAAVVLTLPAVLALRGRWRQVRGQLGPLSVYGLIAVGGCQLCYFNAIQHVSVAVALLIEYSGTLLVVAWVWLRHHNRPTRLTLIGAALALGGLVPVLDLTGAQRVDGVGLAWAVAAAIALAVYFVISARADSPLPGTVLAWGGMAFGAIELGLASLLGIVSFAAPNSTVHLAGHDVSWIVPMLGISLLACAFAYYLGIVAARRLGARLASFIAMTEILFATLFAWLLLGQRPTGMQLAGGAVVLAGIALVRAGEPAEIAPSDGRDRPDPRECEDPLVLAEVAPAGQVRRVELEFADDA